jgi:signal transduction histidine kinase
VTDHAVRRVALASALVVVLIAAAVAVTIVDYRGAVAAQVRVVEFREENAVEQRAELLLWREREAMNEYLLAPDPEILNEIRSLHAGFRMTISGLGIGELDERPSAVGAERENEAFLATFAVVRHARHREQKIRASLDLNRHEEAVLEQLNAIKPLNLREAQAAQAHATRQGQRALVSGLLAGGLAIVGGVGFAVYSVRLLRRSGKQNDDLRRLDRVKDDFIATVSHELRTPLTSINGYLDLVLQGEAGHVPAEQQKFLGVARRNADKLLSVVSDLLFVAQLDAAGAIFARNPVDLSLLARDAVAAAVPAADEAGVELTVVTEGSAWLNGDAQRLSQVFDNLISNALKFTPRGGRVRTEISAAGKVIRLDVSDNGDGISVDDQEQLFERFFRTQSATTQAIQGTGLGLPIVKAIVEGHGGAVTVKSVVGEGTLFRVELPLARVPVAA